MSLAQCQQQIDAREFAEWQAYDQLEPIGDEKLSYLLARVAKLIYWAHRSEHAPEMSIDDFRPWIRQGPPGPLTQDPEQMKQLLLPLFGANP